MGRFNHKAACVDPSSGLVYLTEDREEGLYIALFQRNPETCRLAVDYRPWLLRG